MPRNSGRITVPQITDLSKEELEAWRTLAAHPLLDGRLLEDVVVGADSSTSAVKSVTTTRLSHSLGRKPRGYQVVKASRGSWSVTPVTETNQYADVNVTSAPEFVEYKYVGTDATTLSFTGLDGNLDHEYFLEGYWNTDGAASDVLYLGYNSASPSNQFDQRISAEASTVSGARDASNIRLARDLGTGNEVHYFKAQIGASLGNQRFVFSTDNSRQTTTTAAYNQFVGVWQDVSTRVTSLHVYASNAGAIEAGSWFELYRKPRNATVSIWVF